MSDTVEMWERIWFSAGEAVKWERSWDRGQHWQDVDWPGDKLPFVLFNPTNVEYVIEKKLLSADVRLRPASEPPKEQK